jgi:hypothetical protein
MGQYDGKKDYYSVLGADKSASRKEIERQYKRLAARHHPDRGGDEEEMKAVNEAYRVLKDDATRRAYDTERNPTAEDVAPPYSSPAAQADAFGGRVAGAALSLFLGLTLLLVVRFQYVIFLWPLALIALGLVFMGVWMAHAAISYARESLAPSHFARRHVWAQETVFWSAICGGAYGVYLILTAV